MYYYLKYLRRISQYWIDRRLNGLTGFGPTLKTLYMLIYFILYFSLPIHFRFFLICFLFLKLIFYLVYHITCKIFSIYSTFRYETVFHILLYSIYETAIKLKILIVTCDFHRCYLSIEIQCNYFGISLHFFVISGLWSHITSNIRSLQYPYI